MSVDMRVDADAYYSITEHYGVARWGRDWFAVDRQTGAQLGPPWQTRGLAIDEASRREDQDQGIAVEFHGDPIRERDARMVAMPSADGNYYDDFAQAVADRSALLTRVDALEALLRRLLKEYDEDVLRTPSFVTMDAVRALIGDKS